MDLLAAIPRLRARFFLVLVALIIGAAVAVASRYTIHNGLRLKATSAGIADAQLLVDTEYSALGSIVSSTTDAEINDRSPLFAEYAASGAVTPLIAARAGIANTELSVTANTNEVSDNASPTVSTSYNSAPDESSAQYQVTITASNSLPILDVSAHAPTASDAVRLVDATIYGARLAVSQLDRAQNVPATQSLELRSLGATQGSTVTTAVSATKSLVYGVAVFVVLVLVILIGDAVLLSRRRARITEGPARRGHHQSSTSPAPASRDGSATRPPTGSGRRRRNRRAAVQMRPVSPEPAVPAAGRRAETAPLATTIAAEFDDWSGFPSRAGELDAAPPEDTGEWDRSGHTEEWGAPEDHEDGSAALETLENWREPEVPAEMEQAQDKDLQSGDGDAQGDDADAEGDDEYDEPHW